MTQARFVHIVDDVSAHAADGTGPVLVCALEGFLDAGNASALAISHLIDSADRARVVASLEVDEFYDYRARRPAMTFLENRYTDYDAPRLVVRLLEDAAGTPYLLLTGPEPDIRWEGFAAAVRAVVEHFGVRLVSMLGSVPMAVPHTRPVQLTNHASDEDLLSQPNLWRGELRIPSSAQAVLEMRLGEWGHPVVGWVAHIPHYVAQVAYPQAAVSLLESTMSSTGLVWDLDPLRDSAVKQDAEIASQIEESGEVADVVRGLEQQYDTFHRAAAEGENLLAPDEPLPSGDEIGAQFEQFLAGLDRPDTRPDTPEDDR